MIFRISMFSLFSHCVIFPRAARKSKTAYHRLASTKHAHDIDATNRLCGVASVPNVCANCTSVKRARQLH